MLMARISNEDTAMNFKSSLIAGLSMAASLSAAAAYADMSQDKGITEQVKMEISKHADLGTGISVSTRDGIVYLKGRTSTPLAKSHAEDLARGVPGVTKVVDDIATEK